MELLHGAREQQQRFLAWAAQRAGARPGAGLVHNRHAGAKTVIATAGGTWPAVARKRLPGEHLPARTVLQDARQLDVAMTLWFWPGQEPGLPPLAFVQRWVPYTGRTLLVRRSGETGRRAGLKIP